MKTPPHLVRSSKVKLCTQPPPRDPPRSNGLEGYEIGGGICF